MGISISIKAGTNAATSSVNASGSVQHIITTTEKKTFGIQDAGLKNAVGKYFGRNPNDAYLHSDTPWGDLYKTYNWPQVQTVLVVQSATITGITSEPVIVATKIFSNNSSKKATFNASISDQVNNTTESNWSQTDTVSVEQKIKYEIGFLGTGGGGETSMSYSHSWGKGGSESMSITVGSDSGVSVELAPGESVEAQLSASRGVMKVRVVYKAYLTGSTAINYNPTFKGHHFFSLPIDGVMEAGGLSTIREFTEDIEIGYYSNSKVELKDPTGKLRAVYFAADKAAA
ncbi:hypothetical protein [Nitrosospira sp. NRS527]|uniref:hypothetical protein n=1 Tax=Nitrosospira sp. NRS527 TaxID=155925 RepID=UPI001AFC9CEE|nr:hypothetical protein [Nitrosospira sp. NRS527]BCT68244.1 hypothetical protein NNRS527_01837 [Nitrosospira sp. NRS527]